MENVSEVSLFKILPVVSEGHDELMEVDAARLVLVGFIHDISADSEEDLGVFDIEYFGQNMQDFGHLYGARGVPVEFVESCGQCQHFLLRNTVIN